METVQINPEPEPHPLHQVTPLSKYAAMAVFVVLPFIGGLVGYALAPEKVVEVERVVVRETEENSTNEIPLQTSDSEDPPSAMQAARQEYLSQFTKYPTYEIRPVKFGDLDLEVLFGIDASGVEHQLVYVEVFSRPTTGNVTYYATHVPDSDAGQHLRFAYNSTTRAVKLLETAPEYQDTWFIDKERIAPDGLRFASVHLSNLDGGDPHALYLVDLASDSVRTIKTLPEHETFIEIFDAFANMPMSDVKWVDNSTIEIKIFDATRWVEKSPPVWGQFHPYLRTELIKI
jgi:hypothetical protein